MYQHQCNAEGQQVSGIGRLPLTSGLSLRPSVIVEAMERSKETELSIRQCDVALRVGDRFAVRTVSGAEYELSAVSIRDGIMNVDISCTPPDQPSPLRWPLPALKSAHLVYLGEAPHITLGEPMEVIGIDAQTGDRVAVRTSAVEEVVRVAAPELAAEQ